ncbi:MAG TPA: FAA hydrolase family protein [Candidatus Thioglobus sp.]|jgi:2-keto-4-pentenoate hydratase/2-oxohepta-3-ene-1,7-dioic acid hydratase in catechol pathway|nr:FAA hydrolase family protein [Candidatus Thioglobus sp.]HIL43286.1 FAA hydrolase family protein [Gammaproteobacteria bacterium]
MKTIKLGNKAYSPSKIVCIGLNYVEHVEELNNEIPDEVVIFSKPNSAITSKLSSHHNEQLHYETELCFIYGAGNYIGVGVGLDLTKRLLQTELRKKGLPWERAKAFNGAALFSEFVLLPKSLDSLSFQLSINGTMKQSGNIELMINKPLEVLNEITSFMNLVEGDIVMTGTPKGVGIVKSGDTFHVKLFSDNTQLTDEQWTAD